VEVSSKNSALESGSHYSVNPNPNKKGDQHNHSPTTASATTTAGSTSSNLRTGTRRGGRVPSREGKRAYDRRSGTGRGREIKKSGGGARNWGSDQNEARIAEQQPTSLANDEKVPPEEDGEVNPQGLEEEQKKEAVQVNEEVQHRPDEEDRTMTLDEYLKKKAEEEQNHKLASQALNALSIKDFLVYEIFAAKT
jgi:plasminogen activator inhibitor 1 RNA-binding protein